MTMDSDSADVIVSNMSRNIKFDYWLNESAKDITFEDAFEVDAEIEWYYILYHNIIKRITTFRLIVSMFACLFVFLI